MTFPRKGKGGGGSTDHWGGPARTNGITKGWGGIDREILNFPLDGAKETGKDEILSKGIGTRHRKGGKPVRLKLVGYGQTSRAKRREEGK